MSSSSSKSSDSTGVDIVASPCRRQCCLDDDDQCLGCGRLLSEILDWSRSDSQQRRAICQAAQERLKARQRF